MTDIARIGLRLRKAREEAGMFCCGVRAALSPEIDCCASVWEAEAGQPALSDSSLAAYARAYNVRVDWLKTGDGPMREGGLSREP